MNAYQYCLDTVKGNDYLQFFGLNIIDAFGNKTLPSISIKTKTIYFPRLIEGFVILDHIEAYDELISLFLAWCMLLNDEYSCCDIFLEKLKNVRLSNYTKSSNLFSAIVAKMLFMILHEYGHYAINTNDDFHELLMTGAKDALSQYRDEEKPGEEVADEVNGIISVMTNTNPKFGFFFESESWNDYINSSFYNKAGGLVDSVKKQEEIGADLFAITSLLTSTVFSLVPTYQLKVDLTDAVLFMSRISIIDGSFYNNKLSGIESLLNSDIFAFDNIRYWASVAAIISMDEGDLFSKEDSDIVYSHHIRKMAKYSQTIGDYDEDMLERSFEIARNGSPSSLKDEEKYNKCYSCIMSFIDQLTSLYI